MALRETAPGMGATRKRTHFAYCATPAGKPWDAWIAGPCRWYECHTKGKSKPCLKIVTGGEVACPLCSDLNVPEVIGYQPLYRCCDAKPCCVIVHEDQADVIGKLKWKQPVHVGREPGATAGVWLSEFMGKYPWYTSTLADRQKPADIEPSCVAMWKLPELSEWIAKQRNIRYTPPTSPPEKKTPKARSDGKPFTPPLQAAAARYGAPDAEKHVAEEYAKLIASIERKSAAMAATSTNGNGNH